MTRSRSNCGPRADSSPDSPDVRRYVSVLSLVLAAAPAAAQLDSAALVRLERPRVVAAAERYLREAPVTITAFPAPRSAGGPHAFYSAGDGMSDGWEAKYGFDPLNPNDATLDLDGDGYSNLEEYQAHTRPDDPLGYPPNPPRPVAWWKLDEGTGTNVFDSSLNG